MSEVNSNYNFVPAPDEENVFHPDWSNQVSHDIPFEDGETGEIQITMVAETPIFIRNGHSKKEADRSRIIIERWDKNGIAPSSEEEEFIERYLSFSRFKDIDGSHKYFIPSTSTKGMIRNILEILGRGRIKQVNDHKYSFRDLTKNSLYMRNYESNKVECGWLFQDEEGKWKIEDCEKPLRISHEALDPILNTHFRRAFLNKNPVDKTAAYKYKQVKGNLTHRFRTEKDEYKTLAVLDNGGREGTIVLTGQSGRRNEAEGRRSSGKLYEFVFLKSIGKQELTITDRQKKDFKFIYLDHDQNNISKDWKFWKGKLAAGERIPVFFNRNGTDGVKHFGLAYMYKLPYEKSIHEVGPYKSYINNFHEKDLAETIFGSSDELTDSLKGRVMISHAFSENAVPSEKLEKEILAGPKASYFPFYLNKTSQRMPYMNEQTKIRGFKRYPIHKNTKTGNYDQKQLGNPKVFSFFRPIKAGAKFTTSIRFHNLRKAEIGALISAITFHQQGGKYFHSIGGAKSLGYGKLAVRIEQLQYLKHSVDEYLLEFEQLMERKFEDWLNTPALTELLTMAAEPKTKEINKELVYPRINVPNAGRGEANEFVNYKKDQLTLPNYSEINGSHKFVSHAHKLEINKMLVSGDFEIVGKNVREVKAYLKSNNIQDIPDNFKPKLISKVGEIFVNDKKSKKDWSNLDKTFLDLYEWHTIIADWLGATAAKKLYKDLTDKED